MFYDVLLGIEFLLLAGIVLFTISQKSNIVSVLFYATFIFLLLIVVRQFLSEYLNMVHMVVILCLTIALIHVSITAPALSFPYFKKYIMFSCTMLLFVYIYKMDVPKWLVEFILKVNVVIAVLYPIGYYLLNARTMEADSLTLNFSNPNLTGMYLLHSALYCVLALQYFKNIIFKLAMVVLLAQIYMFMDATRSRASLLAFWGFIAITVISYFWGGKITVTPLVSFLMLIMPLVAVFGYLYLCDVGVLYEKETDAFFEVSDGKSMMSRRRIWEAGMSWFRAHPIVGSYGYIGGKSGVSQMHNTHLDVLVSYGTVPFVLFITALNQCVNRVLKNISYSYQKIALFAFYAVLISGTFEAALVSGGVGLYMLSGGFLIISKFDGLLHEVKHERTAAERDTEDSSRNFEAF